MADVVTECATCGRRVFVEPAIGLEGASVKCPACGAPLVAANATLRLGKYTLLKKIAVGGMGAVYYAKSEGAAGFERKLAIKRMLPHLAADRNFVDMIVNEAKITVLLNHPNIVQIFDLAQEGDEHFIVMEYVPGIAVQNVVVYCAEKQIRVPLPMAVHIVGQTLKGLAYAHSLRDDEGRPTRIVHRDVTPQNLLVTRLGWVKITDFGIAKAANEISSTLPGVVKGKLGYIAPEVMAGSVPDRRADIFSAGVVLWELLATRRLFAGHSDFDVARQVSACVIPPLGAMRDDVEPALEECVARACAREPSHRFQDAESFHDALMRAALPLAADDCERDAAAFLSANEPLFAGRLADEDPALRTPSRPQNVTRTRRSRSRRRLVMVIGAGLVTLAAGGGFAALGSLGGGAPAAPATSPLPPLPPLPPSPAAEPSSTPSPAAPPAAVEHRPDPAPRAPAKPLGNHEIQATVQRSYGVLGKCLRQLDPQTAPSSIIAKLTVAASGRVDGARLEPAIVSASGRCLLAALKAIRFRPGPSGFEITIPLTIEAAGP